MNYLLISLLCSLSLYAQERDPFNFKTKDGNDVLGYGLIHDGETKLIIVKKNETIFVQKKIKKSPSTVKAEGLGG